EENCGQEGDSMKKEMKKKGSAQKSVAPKKKLAKKKAAPKKAQMKMKAGGKKTPSGETASVLKKQVREKSQSVDTMAFAPEGLGSRSGEESGDLQGLSNV